MSATAWLRSKAAAATAAAAGRRGADDNDVEMMLRSGLADETHDDASRADGDEYGSVTAVQRLPHWVYWAVLVVAVLVELLGTTLIRDARGFANPAAAWKAMACYALCTLLCIVAFSKQIELSAGYAVWCACGIAATAVIGKVRFGEAFTLPKVLGLSLCGAGSVLLVLATES